MNRSRSHLVGLTVALNGIRRSRWLDNFQLMGVRTDGRLLIFCRADALFCARRRKPALHCAPSVLGAPSRRYVESTIPVVDTNTGQDRCGGVYLNRR